MPTLEERAFDAVMEVQDKVLRNRVAEMTKPQRSQWKFRFWAASDTGLCYDCEDPIPKLRLKLGKVRCTPCQELADLDGVE